MGTNRVFEGSDMTIGCGVFVGSDLHCFAGMERKVVIIFRVYGPRRFREWKEMESAILWAIKLLSPQS